MAHREPKNTQEKAPAQLPVKASRGASSELQETEHLEMRIPARAEWVRVVRLATAGVASRAGFAYDDIEDIKLAVAEACNNAILHSAGLNKRHQTVSEVRSEAEESTPVVTICWRLIENGICISVSDEGRLAPPGLGRRSVSTPVATDATASPLDELPESGMGLLLIESLMDEVEHESGVDSDTTIHMTKRVEQRSRLAQDNEGSSRPDPDAPVAVSPRPANSASTARQVTSPRMER